MHNKKMSGGAGDISLPDVSKLNDLKDEQIEALIEKLAEVQAHAPQIIAALEAQQEARSRGSRGSKGNNDRKSDRGERTQPPKARQHQPQIREEEEEEEDDDDDDDDDEEDDDFDEDAEYPMVGDGYSDEISVVSDMTTPTVVSSLEIHEEEYYRDMIVGSGMKMNAPKKKDLLSQVAKTNARKTVTAAPPAKKKAADSQLKKPARATSYVAPSKAAPTKTGAEVKKKKSKDGITTTPTGTKKVKKKKDGTSTKKKEAVGPGPSASGGKKKGPQEKATPVMIDDDGFLVDQSTFESFDSSNNPFASAPSFTAGQASDDDGFGAFASFGNPDPAPRKATKPKKLNVTSTGRKKKTSGSASINDAPNSPKSKRKGDRRVSLGA